MSSQSENGVVASEPVSTTSHGSTGEGAEQKRSRKRRRKRPRKPEPTTPTAAPASPGRPASPTLAAPLGAFASLAGGFLSHIDERQVPCAADGCENTWTWTAEEQIRSLGRPAPKRLCDACQNVGDVDVACVVETCKRTWTWTRDAQLKHRTWLKRHGEERPSTGGRKGKKRRADGPPRRKCDLCQAKSATLQERAAVCKVHGCTREVVIDRESQLRAWAALGTTDLDAEFPLPKRMCDVCREFCRHHTDREVPCSRPGCDRTWTYKTGAQLQAFLAGRLEDPVRLCSECARLEAEQASELGPNIEVMPCVVPACEGVWYWEPDMKIAPAKDGDLPTDRMCDAHRREHDLPPRPAPTARVAPATASDEPPEVAEELLDDAP